MSQKWINPLKYSLHMLLNILFGKGFPSTMHVLAARMLMK